MCGIAGIHRRTDKPLEKFGRLADELLLGIENRGKHATGLLSITDDGNVWIEKKTIPANRFIRQREAFPAKARTVMLHARYATRGAKSNPRNAHPVAAGDIAAIHNGTIWNADELFEAFSLPRIGTVDSEIIPAMVDLAGWEKAHEAFEMLEGGMATALINQTLPREVLFAKTSHWPLVYIVTKDLVLWASTEKAIRTAWYRTFGRSLKAKAKRLQEGQIARVNGKVTLSNFEPKPYERPVAPKQQPLPKQTKKGQRHLGLPSVNGYQPRESGRGYVETMSPATQALLTLDTPRWFFSRSDNVWICKDCGQDEEYCICDEEFRPGVPHVRPAF